MLLNFTMKNFRSFCDETVFSMEATRQRDHREILMNEEKARRILPTAVVYGANASGKTNLFRAISVFKQIVREGNLKQDLYLSLLGQREDLAEILQFTPYIYNDDNTVSLEIEFYQQRRYRYGFSYSVSFGQSGTAKIEGEHLFVDGDKVFSRTADAIDLNWKQITKLVDGQKTPYTKEKRSLLNDILTESLAQTDLFLANGFKLVNKLVTDEILGYIGEKILTTLEVNKLIEASVPSDWSGDELAYRPGLVRTINELNIFGPQHIHLVAAKEQECPEMVMERSLEDDEKDTKRPKMTFMSDYRLQGKDNNEGVATLPSEVMESRGTLNFFRILHAANAVIDHGGVLIVDELDSSLHFNTMAAIIRLFHDPEVNKNKAQLVFNTHNPVYMNKNLFRRDQIYIVEKDETGCKSELFSLADFQTSGNCAVRNDQNYMLNYLKGSYSNQPDIDLLAAFGGEDGDGNG